MLLFISEATTSDSKTTIEESVEIPAFKSSHTAYINVGVQLYPLGKKMYWRWDIERNNTREYMQWKIMYLTLFLGLQQCEFCPCAPRRQMSLQRTISFALPVQKCTRYYYYNNNHHYLLYAGYLYILFLRQTVSLGNKVFQLFCHYYLWCLYR